MSTTEPRLTSLSHGGGCGCKIAPGVLSEILKGTGGMPIPPQLLVGIETADDAAVYQLNDEQALIATTDFFMPIVDDPYDFGRIAATNAISDVYAMGGTPILALALVGMPINVLSTATIGRILQGRQRCLPCGRHSHRGRAHHRFRRGHLWPGRARSGAPEAREAQRRCPRGRRPDPGQAAGCGRAQRRAQEGAAQRRRL
jgi:selenophosphate synthase